MLMKKISGKADSHVRDRLAHVGDTPVVRTGLIVVCIILLCGIVSAEVPKADFTCTSTGPLTISCTDQSTGNPTGWAWFFGDEKYDQPWVIMNESTPWKASIDQTSVALSDGSIVVIAGTFVNPNTGQLDSLNQAWRSIDNGITWTVMNSSMCTGYLMAPSSVVLSDGSILVTPGYGSNAVLRSFDKGATWITMNQTIPWNRHHLGAAALSDGRIFIMGGQSGVPSFLNDIWQSVDYGAFWKQIATNPGWTPRSMFSTVVMPDGKIILMGGLGTEGYTNDVWRSTDNIAQPWDQMKLNNVQHTEWHERRYHTSVAMPDNSIVLMGGSFNRQFNETWRSTDYGATWQEINSTPWDSGRAQHTSVVGRDGSIILVGGVDNSSRFRKDAWRFDPKGSAQQNPTHPYTAPGTYTVTLQVYNDSGYTTIRKNITVGNVTVTYYINIMPVPEKHVGDKFTINATTNLPAGQDVLIDIRSPCQQRIQSGEYSGASGTVKVQAGKYNPASPCCDQVNFLLFDVDSSSFKPDVYTINDTAMGIPRLGMSYFYVREGGTTTIPLDLVVIICGIIGACGIVHIIRKQKR